MLAMIDSLNWRWNRFVYWLHDAATRTGIRWLVTLSVWAYDRLSWHLPEEWQLVCGVPFREYTLRHELELARHQARWYANCAYELQCRILFADQGVENGAANRGYELPDSSEWPEADSEQAASSSSVLERIK